MITRRNFSLLSCFALSSAAFESARADAPPSGFLGDYAGLAPTSDAAVKVYRKPDLSLQTFDKLIVEEILFWYADDSPYKGISASDLQRIGRTAFESLQNAVAGRFTIVNEAAPGAIRIRAAITDIRAAKKSKNPLSFTPVGLLKQGVDALSGANIELHDATAEAELSDAISGERLLAIVDTRAGHRAGSESRKASWKEIDATLAAWANHLARQLDAAPAASQDF